MKADGDKFKGRVQFQSESTEQQFALVEFLQDIPFSVRHIVPPFVKSICDMVKSCGLVTSQSNWRKSCHVSYHGDPKIYQFG